MEKTVLVELTSKKIKLAEGIVLFTLFASLLAGFGLLYIAVPLVLERIASVPLVRSPEKVLLSRGPVRRSIHLERGQCSDRVRHSLQRRPDPGRLPGR